MRTGASYLSTRRLPPQANESLWLTMTLHRRLVAPTNGYFAWKSKEGQTNYAQSIAPDEVVSFQLPPIPGDDGALVGHRFSLRVRVKVLQ